MHINKQIIYITLVINVLEKKERVHMKYIRNGIAFIQISACFAGTKQIYNRGDQKPLKKRGVI